MACRSAWKKAQASVLVYGLTYVLFADIKNDTDQKYHRTTCSDIHMKTVQNQLSYLTNTELKMQTKLNAANIYLFMNSY